MTTEEAPKKVESKENLPKKGVETGKISETAKDPDQVEKFREIRKSLSKSELAFSVTSLKAPGSGSKFELTDHGAPVAAATAAVKEHKPEAKEGKPAQIMGPESAPPAKPVDMGEMTRDAEAIRKATGNDNTIARWADKEAINKILEGKTDSERKAIDGIYQQKYGHGLDKEMRAFESGSDLDKFLNVFNRQDNNAENQAARRIHENLLEKHNLIEGRSSSQLEKETRDLLSTKNAAQIAKMDEEYKKTYGVSLKDAINNDTTVSQATKEMAAIYMKGNDKRTDQDTAQLISTSLKNRNTEQFAESMRDASPTARKAFLDNGGEQQVNSAFGHFYSNKDVQHAMDYAREGKLSAATQVADNTGFVFDNAKGSELAISRMTDAERKMYGDGKTLSEGKAVAGLSTEDQKKSSDYYTKLHGALEKTANATEIVKYEDLIAAKGDGSFVSTLAKDRGWVYNSSTADMIGQVRNMTPEQYDDAQKHPERRAELQQMLTSLGKNDIDSKKVVDVYDKMISAKTIEQARDTTKPSVQNEIASSQHWYGNDSNRAVTSIAEMSKADQDKYRSDEQFRNQVDQTIDKTIQNPRALDAAHRMLQLVKDGKDPNSDVIARMERTENFDGSKTGEVARDVEKAFRDDPSLRDRVTNPKTDEDRKFSELFKKTAQDTFGDDYDNFGKPLAEKGRLPLEWKVGLNQGVFSNDYKQAFEDLQQATPEEKQRLKTDPAYRQQVMGYMDETRQQIALATIDQKELKPEDNIRAAVVGWGGSADIVDQLKQIKPEDLDRAKADYAKKYGSSLEGDLMGKLSGAEKDAAERVLTQNLNTEERASIARTQTEVARDGFSAFVSDNVFRSGTGAQADDAQNQTNRAISEQNKMDAAIASGNGIMSNLTPDQIRDMQTKMSAQVNDALKFQATATENNIESKKSGANAAADAAIVTVAVGSLILSGGLDAPLVAGLAVAGAGIKVGSNIALQGGNYDMSFKQVAQDGVVGSVEAATAALGPGEIAAVFGIGKTAATTAARLVVTEAGEQLFVTGGKEAVETGTQEIVRNALASGAKQLNQKDFRILAEKVVTPELTGAAREAAVAKLSESLSQNVSEQIATGVVRRATQVGLNAAGGGAGGGTSGLVQGTTEWDSRNSLAQNLGHIAERTGESALSGAVVGGAISAATPVIGRIIPRRAVNEGEIPLSSPHLEKPATSDLPPGERPLPSDTSPVPPENLPSRQTPPEAPPARPGQTPPEAPPPTGRTTPPEAPPTTGRTAPPEAPPSRPGQTPPEAPPTTGRPTPPERPENPNSRPSDAPQEKPAAPKADDASPAEGQVAKPYDKKWPVNERGQVVDSKGNIIENEWPKVPPEKIEAVRTRVREELAQVKAKDGQNVLEKLQNSGLSAEQQTRVIDSLGEVREHYARTFNVDPDQPVNWIHTQGELGRVIDAAKASGASATQTEDALLASMFSDSLKTKANFSTHHLDGELAAEHILKDRLGGDFTAERLDGILHAIREHQIAPPKFMAGMYQGAWTRSIQGEGRALTAEETAASKTLFEKMSAPFKSPQVDAPDGGKMLELTDAERSLLKRTGNDNWRVPSESSPWYKISRALIDGDGIDNYATAGGLSKIIQIRGPETASFFKDANFRYESPERTTGPATSSQESWRDSFKDFTTVASPEGLKVAQAAVGDAEKSAIAAQGRVDDWLHQELGIPKTEELPVIPGWTGKPRLDAAGKPLLDAGGRPIIDPDKLTYPNVEQRWWNIQMTPAGKRSAEDVAWFEDPANRYKDLSPQEIKQFQLAKQIRDRYAAELRKEQRVAGDSAPVYEPVH